MRSYNFRFEILNNKYEYVKNVYPISCQVDYDCLSGMKLSVNMTIKDDDYNYNDKYLVIKNENEIFATVIIATSIRDKLNKTVKLTGYDFCILLEQRKVKNDFIVPAFTGLGAPYWDMNAKGAIFGLTRGTKREHIIRAMLESITYQCVDVFNCIEEDTNIKIQNLK